MADPAYEVPDNSPRRLSLFSTPKTENSNSYTNGTYSGPTSWEISTEIIGLEGEGDTGMRRLLKAYPHVLSE